MARSRCVPPAVDDVARVVGESIRRARIEVGKSQEEAAAAAGIDYKRWQRIEAGQVNTTLRTLVRVSAAVGSDFWSIVRRDPL